MPFYRLCTAPSSYSCMSKRPTGHCLPVFFVFLQDFSGLQSSWRFCIILHSTQEDETRGCLQINTRKLIWGTQLSSGTIWSASTPKKFLTLYTVVPAELVFTHVVNWKQCLPYFSVQCMQQFQSIEEACLRDKMGLAVRKATGCAQVWRMLIWLWSAIATSPILQDNGHFIQQTARLACRKNMHKERETVNLWRETGIWLKDMHLEAANVNIPVRDSKNSSECFCSSSCACSFSPKLKKMQAARNKSKKQRVIVVHCSSNHHLHSLRLSVSIVLGYFLFQGRTMQSVSVNTSQPASRYPYFPYPETQTGTTGTVFTYKKVTPAPKTHPICLPACQDKGQFQLSFLSQNVSFCSMRFRRDSEPASAYPLPSLVSFLASQIWNRPLFQLHFWRPHWCGFCKLKSKTGIELSLKTFHCNFSSCLDHWRKHLW